MKAKNYFTIPNLITFVRLVGALCLVFVKPFTIIFFVVYTICGVSDAIDGWVARATKSASDFGAKLDSVADLLFYSVMIIKLLPVLWDRLPRSIWCVGGIILLMRLFTYLYVAIKYKRFAAQHTYMNKLTGAVLFTVPYFLMRAGDVIVCSAVCVIGVLASVEELLIHVFSKEYCPSVKTIWMIGDNVDVGA